MSARPARPGRRRALAARLAAAAALWTRAPAHADAPAMAPVAAPPRAGAPAPRSGLGVTRYALANGLEVILAPDPTVTSVVVHVRYHVGSRHEQAGRTGFAHLFEHLMFKGSRHVPDGRFDTLLEAAGGWNNGTTNTDRTTYYEQVPAGALGLALYLEADRLAGLWDAMGQAVLDNQRDVVKNERRQSYENRPYGRARLAIQEALWPDGHGYHHPTIGSMADLSAATLADARAFWRTYYRPSNATLVVVGGFDPGEARRLIEARFGWLPAEPRPAPPPAPPPTPRATPVALRDEDDVTATRVSLTFRGDAALTPGAFDLELAARILGGGRSSRLHRALVLRDRQATSVAADFSPAMLGGQLELSAEVRDGVDPEVVRAALARELARLRDEPVGDDELARATAGTLAELLAALEALPFRADLLGTWAALAGEPDQLEAVRAGYRAVTPASLQASARRWLGEQAAVTMIVRPRAPAAPGAPPPGGPR